MKTFKIRLDIFPYNVYFVYCPVKDLKLVRMINAGDLDSEKLECVSGGLLEDSLIWVNTDQAKLNSVLFLSTLLHETIHFVDAMMEELNLEGTEVRAYTSDYIFGKILTHLKYPFQN